MLGAMGLCENWVLPRLLDLAMRKHVLDRYRRRAIKSAHGLVLDIGVGSGLNLSLYGPAVGRVVGLDPSSELLRLARSRVAHSRIPVSLVRASAQHVPFADAAFVAVVMTWTLCSIPESDRRVDRDAAGSQAGRAIAFRRARSVAGNSDCSLAASFDAVLEVDLWGLSPRSQDGRPDPGSRVSS